MNDSWDWIDEHKKKERQRKRFFYFCLFVSLPALLITMPSMLSPPVDEPKLDREAALNDALNAHPSDHTRVDQPVEPTTTLPAIKPDTASAGTEAATAEKTHAASAPAVTETLPKSALPVPEYEPDPILPKAQRALSRLTRQLEQIGDRRLQQHGGEPWKNVSALKTIASDMRDTTAALAAAESALRRVETLSLHVDSAELLTTTEHAKPNELLAAFVEFRSKHPEQPLMPEIDARIKQISREAWLQMATDELSSASPDDAGFAEGWMPIAGAWQLVGNDREAREAIRRARDALPRMTKVERIVESTIDLCQHESFDPKTSEKLITDAANFCGQVSSTSSRSRFYANLSGLAARFGHRSLAARSLEQSLALIDTSEGPNTSNKAVYSQQFRAAAWTEPPEAIFAICAKLDKLKYPKLYINANGYAHAAMAAARHNDRRQFLRGMFTAETHLAQTQTREYPYYLFVARLAEANMLQRRWRAAVIIANNIPDPHVRASILFRVMKDAPQEVYSPHLADLFERFADQRWAAPAVAGHAEHRIRSRDSLLDVVAWSKGLPLASQRAAAYAGIARATGTVSSDHHNQSVAIVSHPPDVADSVSLIESAEQIADTIEDPLHSASVWLRIARTWNLLDKTQRYRHAVLRIHDRLFDAWKQVWDARPPVKKSYNGGYVDVDDRHRPKEKQTIASIITCLWRLSELQADFGDASGSMETCLNIATATNALNAAAPYNDENFLHLKAIAHRLQSETGVGPDSFPYPKHLSYRYTRALLAARAKDIPGLQAAIPELVEHMQRRNQSKKEYAKPGRAYAELAILFAERGDIKSYRDARRSAESSITQGASPAEYKIMLATADVYAGELALAESNLVRGSVRWFGDANRPRSRLAIELSKTGKWADAIEHAKKISLTFPSYRADAWAAIAQSRYQNERTGRDKLLEWSASMESPLINVSILCGFGMAASAQQ